LCTFEQIHRYRARISGPLLDRIDLHVAVDAVPYRDYAQSGSGEPSALVRERVLDARARQAARLGASRCNASVSDRELRALVPLAGPALALVESAIDAHGLSSRAVGRVLKVARTIADLAGAEAVSAAHVAEAVDLRLLDRGAHDGVAADAA
jgi:magnesium chelatase family protein